MKKQNNGDSRKLVCLLLIKQPHPHCERAIVDILLILISIPDTVLIDVHIDTEVLIPH